MCSCLLYVPVCYVFLSVICSCLLCVPVCYMFLSVMCSCLLYVICICLLYVPVCYMYLSVIGTCLLYLPLPPIGCWAALSSTCTLMVCSPHAHIPTKHTFQHTHISHFSKLHISTHAHISAEYTEGLNHYECLKESTYFNKAHIQHTHTLQHTHAYQQSTLRAWITIECLGWPQPYINGVDTGTFGRKITKYMFIYSVCKRFWPTLATHTNTFWSATPYCPAP